ncbi:MAG TPA: PEGA domain-containing protein [Polyangiaceae bacterium]|nr:PEGA domain-containing protein [Polyangiaceae bacterium]
MPKRPRLRLLSASGFAISVVLNLARPASADQPSAEAVAEARRNEAKARFDEGVAAFRERRYADAVQAFQRADAIAPSAALSFNIARAFERLDNPTAALRWYRDFLRRSPHATNVQEVQARISELAAKVAQRGVQQITVLSTPDGAAVLIDNQPVGSTPLTIELVPGRHQVELRRAGYRDQRGQLTLEPLIPQDVNVRLELLVPGAAPAASTAPSPAPARQDQPSTQPRPLGVTPWIVLGAGGASLMAAFGFELGRRSAESEAERASQREYREHYDTMLGRQTTARVLLGVGGTLLATSGVFFVLNQPRNSTPRLALGCSSGLCRATAVGSFE